MSAVDSLLVNVAVLAAVVCPTVAVPKAKAAGLMVSGRSPVPESATVCGESGDESLMAREPVSAPAMEGVKFRLMAQDAPAFSDEPQVLLAMTKFPVTVMELMVRLAEPVFLSFTAFVVLGVFTTCGLKARLIGEGNTIGLSATVKGSAAKAAQEAPLGKLSTHT